MWALEGRWSNSQSLQSTSSRSRLHRLLPSLAWVGELADARVLRSDILAGVTVALVLIPQSMAYAQLAGLPAYYGLYAAFLPPNRRGTVRFLTPARDWPGCSGFAAHRRDAAAPRRRRQSGLYRLRNSAVSSRRTFPNRARAPAPRRACELSVAPGRARLHQSGGHIIATSQLDKIFGVRVEKAAHHYETVLDTVRAAASYTHWPTVAMAVGAFPESSIGIRPP